MPLPSTAPAHSPAGETPVFRSLWIGPRFSLMEAASASSVLRLGYRYQLYTYEDVTMVPPGVEIMDANDIIPRSRIFRQVSEGDSKGSLTAFSNIFRWELLYRHGGVWLDSDLVLLRPPKLDQEYLIASELRGPPMLGRMIDLFPGRVHRTGRAASCFMKLPSGSELARRCVEFCMAASFEKWAGEPFGTTGVKLLRRTVKELRLQRYLAPYGDFCPVHFWEAAGFNDPLPIPMRSTAVHLWSEMWRRNGWGKNRVIPGSLYDQLTKHVPDRQSYAAPAA